MQKIDCADCGHFVYATPWVGPYCLLASREFRGSDTMPGDWCPLLGELIAENEAGHLVVPVRQRLAKTIAFRAVSFLSTLLLARLWFGDWHISGFQVFLLFYCSAIYYAFEWAWNREPAPRAGEGEL